MAAERLRRQAEACAEVAHMFGFARDREDLLRSQKKLLLLADEAERRTSEPLFDHP